MNPRSPLYTALAALFSILVAQAGMIEPLSANQIEAAEPIDISLKDADLRQTLQSFAAISGMDFKANEDIEGNVTLDVQGEPWPQVLDQMCRDHDLACEKLKGEPPILRIRRADPHGEYPLVAGFAESVSLSLKAADLRETLMSFGAITGLAFEIADEVKGSVTLNVEATPWTVLLNEVCRLSSCRLEWGEDVIHVEPAVSGEMEVVNMSLAGADLRETLSLFSAFPILGAEGVEVEIDPAVSGEVTVELEEVNWQQSLDLICDQADCSWSLAYGDPSVLRIVPTETADTAKKPRLATVEEPGAPAKMLGYRLTLPGEAPLDGAVKLTWADPIQVLDSEGAYQVRLNWIPLGPELSAVLPTLERCDAARNSASLLEPVVFPLAQTIHRHANGVSLELFPAEDGALVRPTKRAARDCGKDAPGEVMVTVRRLADKGSERPRPSHVQTVDEYLLVRPVEARQAVAAVISLGVTLDGRRSLVLLQPSADRKDVVLETLSLAAGESLEKIVQAEDHPYELKIEY